MLNLENKLKTDCLSYRPVFFRVYLEKDKNSLEELLKKKPYLQICDQIEPQLDDLVKSQNPKLKKPGRVVLDDLKVKHLNGRDLQSYGVWIHYPWNNTLVHCLDEEEFVEVRTNRNRYKITREEQHLLSTKKIGVIGLSVGQSIALTLAMERTCGELRLADFDTAELSNLNRLRTGIQNIGVHKTIIAAREIAEIDPFLKVVVFNEGLHEGNIDPFFSEGGRLDLLVEVCDGLDIKIESRFKARELKIPVIMDTNDRGMLDVERFDLEPGRAILHGLAEGLDPKNIKDLTNEEKIPYILNMISAEQISTRLKASMLEVEQSLNTWPQLASSVTLGGALTTDVSRRVLLDQFHQSGRYYIDLEELVCDQVQTADVSSEKKYQGPAELTVADLERIAIMYVGEKKLTEIPADKIEKIVRAAVAAPSGGNSQPWKLLYKNGLLFIFHDVHYSYSLLDHQKLGSYIAFGAMLENIQIIANQLNLEVKETVFPLAQEKALIAVLNFNRLTTKPQLTHLAPIVGSRVTNRLVSERVLLDKKDKEALSSIAQSIPNAKMHLFEDTKDLEEFAEVLTNAERLRFLHPRGHYDTFVNELRFNKEEIERLGDGMDVATLNMKQSDLAALRIAKDAQAIDFLRGLEQGYGFKKISKDAVLHASAIGVVSLNGHDPIHFLQGGRAVERVWLEANYRKISFQPISQVVFLNELYSSPDESEFNAYERTELKKIGERLSGLLSLEPERHPVFVFRLTLAEAPLVRSLRRPLDKQFFIKS